MSVQVLECPPIETAKSAAAAGDLAALKARQQTMWASGDFAVIGTTLQIVGETLCEAVDLHAGERVLDVACGSGNATLAAARRFCTVTGVDYVPKLLANAGARAEADGLSIKLEVGDAEQLPFADAAFDVVLSTYGVMFAPNQEKAAAELLRVCAPGGRIGLANWTPEGFIGQLLKTVGAHPGRVSRGRGDEALSSSSSGSSRAGTRRAGIGSAAIDLAGRSLHDLGQPP